MSTSILTGSLVDALAGLVAEDADAVALVQALDPEIQAIAALAEQCAFFSRVPSLTEAQADKAARWFGLVDLEGWATAGLERKRTVLAQMVNVYRRRGTRWAWDRVTELMETPALWDGGAVEWDAGAAVWDIRTNMLSLTEWWQSVPPDPPFTYRVDALIEHRGLTLTELANLMQILDAYVPVRAHLLELSETMTVESTLVCGGFPEIGLHTEVL